MPRASPYTGPSAAAAAAPVPSIFPEARTAPHTVPTAEALRALKLEMFYKRETTTVDVCPWLQEDAHLASVPAPGTGQPLPRWGAGPGGVCHGDGGAPPPRAQEWEAGAAQQMAKAQNNSKCK